jgi:hypothetical protein
VVRRPSHVLSDTQFRFVPGTDGAEAIQSVDFPDRHLRVVDGAVRMEAGPPTEVRRVPKGRGVRLQLAGDATRYLRHKNGTVVTGDATVFLLG